MGSDILWCSCAKSQAQPTNTWLRNGEGIHSIKWPFSRIVRLSFNSLYYVSVNQKPFVGHKQKTWKGFTCGKWASLINIVIHNYRLGALKDENPLLTCSYKLWFFSFSFSCLEKKITVDTKINNIGIIPNRRREA